MKKEELSKLRSLYATQSMVRALQMRGRENIDKYRYHLAARVQQLDALLKVSVCVREAGICMGRINGCMDICCFRRNRECRGSMGILI